MRLQICAGACPPVYSRETSESPVKRKTVWKLIVKQGCLISTKKALMPNYLLTLCKENNRFNR